MSEDTSMGTGHSHLTCPTRRAASHFSTTFLKTRKNPEMRDIPVGASVRFSSLSRAGPNTERWGVDHNLEPPSLFRHCYAGNTGLTDSWQQEASARNLLFVVHPLAPIDLPFILETSLSRCCAGRNAHTVTLPLTSTTPTVSPSGFASLPSQ